MSGDIRARLAEKMNVRRVRLRQSWAEIARRAGMDESNLRRIRNGKIEISDLAMVGLESALELKEGSIQSFLDGGSDDLEPHPPQPWPPGTAPSQGDRRYSQAGYVATLLDDLAKEWGEGVLHEAWRIRESKMDLPEQA